MTGVHDIFPPDHAAAVVGHMTALHRGHGTATTLCPACLCIQEQNYGLEVAGNSL